MAYILPPDEAAGEYHPQPGDLVTFPGSLVNQNRVYEVIHVAGDVLAYRLLADHYVDSLENLREISMTPLRKKRPAFIAKDGDPGPIEIDGCP